MPIRHASLLATLLSLIGGYVDTFGFIALFGLFTAHITGNFVLIGSMLVHPAEGGWIKLMAFPAFMAGVALARLVVLAYEKRQRSPLRLLFGLQALLLGGFMLAGLCTSQPLHSDRELAALLAGMSGAAGMAIQGAMGRTVLAGLMPTSMMTGNVIGMLVDLVDVWFSGDEVLKAPARERLRQTVPGICGFVLGALGAALAYQAYHFWALLLPIVLLLGLVALPQCFSEFHRFRSVKPG